MLDFFFIKSVSNNHNIYTFPQNNNVRKQTENDSVKMCHSFNNILLFTVLCFPQKNKKYFVQVKNSGGLIK